MHYESQKKLKKSTIIKIVIITVAVIGLCIAGIIILKRKVKEQFSILRVTIHQLRLRSLQ